MFQTIRRVLLVSLIGMFAFTLSAQAKTVPVEDSEAPYFFVFGPEGNPLWGAEDSQLELFIDVPDAESRNVSISIYDPDTAGARDFRSDPENEWDTATTFSVYGTELLDEKSFGPGSRERDRRYFTFGPFDKTQGEKTGTGYRFRVVAKTTAGDDANLFRVKFSPDTAEAFGNNLTFRLRPEEGSTMNFYLGVPPGTTTINFENWDLDLYGGTGSLFFPGDKHAVDIADSRTGEWRTTKIDIPEGIHGRLRYQIVRGTQSYAHAGVRATDQAGNLLPVYFQPGHFVEIKPVAVVTPERPAACNTFTFDATDSYDVDNQKLDFHWEFGDGNTSTEPIVTHTFERSGDYNVVLTVTDNSGLQCSVSSTSQVVSVNTPPTANFSAPDLVCTGSTVTFDGGLTQDDSTNITYTWNFGDRTMGDGKTVTHTYAQGGTYTVNLHVNDNQNSECSTDAISKTIRVNTPPVADAGSDVSMCLGAEESSKDVSFSASGSSDADGDDLTYLWSFGDGNTGQGRNVTHTYTQAGDYSVTLTVNDQVGSDCSIATDTLLVNLHQIPVANAGSDQSVCTGQTVSFSGSSSLGEGLNYTWDFGDGNTASGASVSHAYTKGGDYTVRLTVDDGQGTSCSTATDTARVSVNAPPVAALAETSITCIGDSVTFDASDSYDADGDRLSYFWDFGDGNTKEGGRREKHTYEKGGNYTVRVSVDDGSGGACSSATTTRSIRVNTPPVADVGDNLVCCVEQVVTFDGERSFDADGDALTYTWDFGDGNTATGPKVTHAYTKTGKYLVVLTVTDGSGTDCNSSSDSFVADVNAKPVAIMKVR